MVLSLQTVRVVDEIVAGTQAAGRAPSVVAAVIRDGTIAHVAAAGGAVPAPNREVQYRIGSITKSMTAALLLGLRDEGRLSLDDLVTDHVGVPALDGLRLRQILGHAAGLQREPDGDWWERSVGGSLDSLLERVTAQKRAFDAYDRFHYSNLAYGILGGVIEKVTGVTWWQALSERILSPLGMARTTYEPEEPFARGYVVHPWHETMREEPRYDAGAMAPAGQLWSTVEDLSRWATVLGSDDRTVLDPATVDQMCVPVVLADQNWTGGYGLGLQLWRRGERVYVGHTGSMPGYLAVLVVHRPSRTGVVGFANAFTLAGQRFGAVAISIVEAVLEHEPAPAVPLWRPAAVAPPEVEPLCGRWWWMGIEAEAHWDAGEGELVLRRPRAPGEDWRFTPTGPDTWLGRAGEQAGEPLRVLRDSNGSVVGLDIATFVYLRDPLPPG